MIYQINISLLSNTEKVLERSVYNRIYKLFNDNSLIYSLQFGFRQKYLIVHAPISLTENIRKNLDGGNIGFGIFVDLQRAFDTVEQDIFLSKLEHCSVCNLANDGLNLSNEKQYVSISGCNSSLAIVRLGVFLKGQFLVQFCF